eukprot:SAG31_NODE_3165_length_4601_cov_2.917814_2_plen_113_part_00
MPLWPQYAVVGSPHAFKMEVNEIGWNNSSNLFFLTTGNGTVEVYNFASGAFTDEKLLSLEAHTMNCLCIKFDPRDKYFAVGMYASAVIVAPCQSSETPATTDGMHLPEFIQS